MCDAQDQLKWHQQHAISFGVAHYVRPLALLVLDLTSTPIKFELCNVVCTLPIPLLAQGAAACYSLLHLLVMWMLANLPAHATHKCTGDSRGS